MNNQDCIVNLWLVKAKGCGTVGAVNALLPGSFLKIGNGGNRDPDDGNQPNMLQVISTFPLNNDNFTLIKHYRFRMRRGIGLAVNSNTASEIAPTGVGNIEMSKSITHKMTAPGLKYNSNADLLPENFYPVWLCYATNADGTAYGDTLQVSCCSQMYYKDA